ncbi:MAG TPA: aldo/keto reductase [Acidimicrobiales bacterium]|nr:aldo/keto reductase [Acidimicrobiales bacterium]
MLMAPVHKTEVVPLASGGGIPLVGFGTWELQGDDAYNGVLAALEIGYRHIDTATGYANEDRVGAAVRDSGLDRGNVFITTKCPPELAGRELETLERSLALLGTEFVDLWLVHWPPDGKARPATWEQFIVAQQQGKARAIGVSNYSIGQVDELIEATGQAPAVNQIPWSPFSYDPTTAGALAERGTVLEGYSPLKRSSLDHPVLLGIGRAHGKTPAQVILRWHVQHRYVVIPRSARRARIEENFGLFDFELTEEEIARVDALAP